MKEGDIVIINTGKRGRRPKGQVVDVQYRSDPPTARVIRKGYGIEVYPIDCLTAFLAKGHPA